MTTVARTGLVAEVLSQPLQIKSEYSKVALKLLLQISWTLRVSHLD